MSINRRQTYFPGGENDRVLLPKPEQERDVKDKKMVEASRMPRLSSAFQRSSRPAMRVSLKNGENPWTNYATLSKVHHAGQGRVAQRRGQLGHLVFIKQVGNCTQDALQRLKSASHENVLPFTAAYLYKQSIYLVYNYLPFTVKELVGWYLSRVQIATVCNAIAHGLDYLHRELDMVHGSLDTSTVVVGRDGQVKIANVGEAMIEKPKSSEKEDREAFRKILWDLLSPSTMANPETYDETVKDFLEKLGSQSIGALLEPRARLNHLPTRTKADLPQHAFLQQAGAPGCLIGTVYWVDELRVREVEISMPDSMIGNTNDKF